MYIYTLRLFIYFIHLQSIFMSYLDFKTELAGTTGLRAKHENKGQRSLVHGQAIFPDLDE